MGMYSEAECFFAAVLHRRRLIDFDRHAAEVLGGSLRHAAKSAIKDGNSNQAHFGALEEFDLTLGSLVGSANANDVASDGHFAALVEVAALIELEQTLIVSEGVHDILAILGGGGDHGHTEEG